MANFEKVQSMATEQALREQNQQLRKQLEDMNAQMQALMIQLQINMTAQSSQVSQEAQLQNTEHVLPPPAPATIQVNLTQQEPAYPSVSSTFVNVPPTAAMGQSSRQTEQLEYILNKLNTLEGNQGAIDPR
jgi:hypothetical protein